MQIHRLDGLHAGILSHIAANAVPPSTKKGGATPATASSERSAPSATALGLSEQSLLDDLQQIPEVRPEVVDAARQRVQQGDYLTRSAAEETAAAIVRTEQ